MVKHSVCVQDPKIQQPGQGNKSKYGIEADYDSEWKVDGVDQIDWGILANQEPFVKRYEAVDYPSMKTQRARSSNGLIKLELYILMS